MDLLSELVSKGWNLSKEGLELCKEGMDRVTVSAVIQKALDMDLKEIGGNFFPEDMKASKLDFILGSCVVQIQKIKNASAPKYEYGSGAPPILRLLLTDGNMFVNCLQWGQWKSINMDTPPGTKIYLKPGKIMMQNSFMLLSENQFTVLGGCVAPMVEKWELCKRLASHVRTKENLDGTGPPPWIPFGKPINAIKTKSNNFRALDQEPKEVKEDAVFKQQRLANIAEVSRVKEGKPKVFGGGKDVKPMNTKSESVPHSYNNNFNESAGYNRTARGNNEYENNQSPRKDNRSWSNHETSRTQSQDGTSNHGQHFTKDKRLDQKNKFNASGFHNDRNQRTYQQKTFGNSYRETTDNGNSSRRFQRSNNDRHQANNDRNYNHDRRSNDIEDLTQKTSQVKLHGYDTQNSGKVFVASKPFLKPGVEVMAKYWEDNKFYRAVIHAVGQEGKTCVVHFLEYGNYEEVLVDDVQQLQSNSGWDVGPISFRPSHYDSNQDFPPISEFHHNSNRSHGQRYGNQERQRASRQDHRPSAKLYQPPQQRQPS
ncbi:tudor domain-containing protein 3 [Trichonephila inaurata madagascariensis]|uniref:Tudor domain-containing protein 3 n=1 Tax=Trichonephila inaurata madagascariensis TaxID=2747483 RepID=A0A8X6XNC6_9ARAC|nr:tudor domain-containing protein 3 [Trichonephila inaurata madagascariensis]